MSTPEALQEAHRHFAATCFNDCWTWFDRQERRPDEDDAMLLSAFASLWHWTRRQDTTARERSVGWWQCSRAAALAGLPELARHCGRRCLAAAEALGEQPFYLGYAQEALARAELTAGQREQAAGHLAQARTLAAQVVDADERAMLEADLEALAG
jgi:hypothetical protein